MITKNEIKTKRIIEYKIKTTSKIKNVDATEVTSTAKT